jgi:glucose uptake protein GlcU
MIPIIYIIGAILWGVYMTFCLYVYDYRGWRMLLAGFLHGLLWPLSLVANFLAFLYVVITKRP